jgi:L-alanine-DL-glutamate epimerase-like enolase superfamily enzyme
MAKNLAVSKLRITGVERVRTVVPFADRMRTWNSINIPLVPHIEVLRARTNSEDLTGYGESQRHEAPGGVSEEAIERVCGRHPAELMGDDSLGLSLQMALFDVVGKALELPAHKLFALPQVRDASPVSWWNMDASPETLAAEARDAASAGYLAHKIKARPWLDVRRQVAAIQDATPPGYVVDIDWNGTLLSPANAIPLLRELDGETKIGLYESPIKQDDVIGMRRVRESVAHPLVEHFKESLFPPLVHADAVDGFVVSSDQGASRFIRDGLAAEAVNKSFFIQMIGTGISTAFALQLSAVLKNASWPMVTCMNAFSDDLITRPVEVVRGEAKVPDGPGLGVDVDEEAVERYRVGGSAPVAEPRRLVRVELPGLGTRLYVDFKRPFVESRTGGIVPPCEPGVSTDVVDDDGSAAFDHAWRKAFEARYGVWE